MKYFINLQKNVSAPEQIVLILNNVPETGRGGNILAIMQINKGLYPGNATATWGSTAC